MFQSSQISQCSWKEAHSLTHMPFRSWCTVCQRAKGQHHHKNNQNNQKSSSVIQLDHSFYKVQGETVNLKVLTLVETVTAMSGAMIVPDLSASQLALKVLKQLTAVNGFAKSVIQCDGHSSLLRLQEQVGQEATLPIYSINWVFLEWGHQHQHKTTNGGSHPNATSFPAYSLLREMFLDYLKVPDHSWCFQTSLQWCFRSFLTWFSWSWMLWGSRRAHMSQQNAHTENTQAIRLKVQLCAFTRPCMVKWELSGFKLQII